MSAGIGTEKGVVLLDQLPLVTYVAPFDAPWTVDYVSPQIEALLGFAADEWMQEPDFWLGRVAPEHRQLFLDTWTSVRDSEERISVEYRMLARDGRRVWVRDVAKVAHGDEGTLSIQGFLTDITREKELELELARERAQTDAFFRDSSVGMAITDEEGRFVRVNEALARMNGITSEEHVGRHLRDINPLIDAHVEPLLAEVRRTGVALQGRELTTTVATGEAVSSLVSYFPIDAAGGSTHFGGVVVDVTELHRAVRERTQTEREYRRLIEQLPLVTYVNTLGPDFRTTYVSPQIEALFGHPPQAWLDDGSLWDSIVHPDDLPGVQEQEAHARATRGGCDFEYRIVRPDGSIRWVLDLMHVVCDASGAALFEQGFVIDVTARKRAEQAERDALDALRRSEEQFRAVFDNALDAMAIADDHGRYVDVNPAACVLHGRSRDEMLSCVISDIPRSGYESVPPWAEFLARGSASGGYVVLRDDGTQRDVEFSATANVLPGRHLSIMRDVTDRKELERSLWQVQKLDSVGTLAGGVAHDFNNMLTAIGGYSQLLLGRLGSGSVEYRHAEEISRAAERAAKLTAQLLAFGRRQILQPRAVDLNALVGELSVMLARVVGSEVDLVLDQAVTLDTVSADPGQIEQVIRNLVVNAVDAMPSGGRIVISTRNAEVSDVDRAELGDGRYVELCIADSGHGMDADTLEHVFEPFFTTKGVGLGDGLGLSTAYGIVKQSGGAMLAESNAGAGSTFRVLLPVAG